MAGIISSLYKLKKNMQGMRRNNALASNVYHLLVSILYNQLLCLLTGKKMVIISLYEHIGDIISCEPVIGYVQKKYNNAKIFWAVKKDYAELLECHPALAGVIKMTYFAEWVVLKKKLQSIGWGKDNIIDLHMNGRFCSVYKTKLVKPVTNINFNNHLNGRSQLQAFTIAEGLPELSGQPTFYVNKQKSPGFNKKPYMVFHTRSNMGMKDWNEADWLCLSKFCEDAGFYVVEVGLEPLVKSTGEKYVDFTGKKSLQQIANLIKDCDLYIGIDSGFAHMANALMKNGLILIGQYKIDKTVFNNYNPFTGLYQSPDYIVYAKNNIVASLTCNEVKNRVAGKLQNLKNEH